MLEVAGEPLAPPAGDIGDLLDDFDEAADGSPGAAVGEIRVSLREDGSDARIVVADTGPGIPDEGAANIERIFEAFVTSKTHGTGLGLPMVQQIAVDHGGSIRLVETGPQGTIFELSLPACDPPGASVFSESSA